MPFRLTPQNTMISGSQEGNTKIVSIDELSTSYSMAWYMICWRGGRNMLLGLNQAVKVVAITIEKPLLSLLIDGTLEDERENFQFCERLAQEQFFPILHIWQRKVL